VLTEKGRDFHAVISALRQWGQNYLFEEGETMHRVIEATTGRPPAQMILTSQDGVALSLDDIEIVPVVVSRADKSPQSKTT
jgi:hypothetical protein